MSKLKEMPPVKSLVVKAAHDIIAVAIKPHATIANTVLFARRANGDIDVLWLDKNVAAISFMSEEKRRACLAATEAEIRRRRYAAGKSLGRKK